MQLRPGRSFARDFLSHYNKSMKEVEVWSPADPHRVLSLRCSALPFCPLDFFTKIANNGMARSLDMRGLFYTSIGTTVHSVMQEGLSQHGHRLFGDWKCRKCYTVEPFSTIRACCGQLMQYEEVSVDYRGIKGHVDTLFALDGKAAAKMSHLPRAERMEAAKTLELVIVDYKTTSERAKKKKEVDPGSGYISQIRAYAYLLTKQFGLQIKGVMLAFIPRDNPQYPTVWEQQILPHDHRLIRDNLRTWKAAHKDVIAATRWSHIVALKSDYGLCADPYCDTCRTRDVDHVLKTAYKRAKAENRLPIKQLAEDELVARSKKTGTS